MSQQLLFEPVPCDKFDLINKEELITLYKGIEKINKHLQSEVTRLIKENEKSEQKNFFISEEVLNLKKKLFGASSEKEKVDKGSGKKKRDGGPKGQKKVLLPSERYPNVPIIEEYIELEAPMCSCCGNQMSDSGMTEDSEELVAIPKKYQVKRTRRRKYRCSGCHSGLMTAPIAPRIFPGSSYSDEMILDVALSKYLDLIPIERYAQMAAREGVLGIPPHSLIRLTHRLADFVKPVYDQLKKDVTSSKVLHADETPHKMLEGSAKKSWYLWGFSNDKSTFFEIHGSRSGEIASDILMGSSCVYLMSDVYSGYIKAVKKCNKWRKKQGLPLITEIYCNAHARRYFKKAKDNFPDETRYFLYCYKKIYRLLKRIKGDPSIEDKLSLNWLNIYMRAMKCMAEELQGHYLKKSSMGRAINYFLKNFRGLSLFSTAKGLPIDNNAMERLLRSPVVGRKTWYGTHSKRGAETAAILFSLVESCKLNNVNPRQYFRDLVVRVHVTGDHFTPREYASGKGTDIQVPDSS